MTKVSDKTLRILRTALIVLITVFMLGMAIRNYSIWEDELFTLHLVEVPIPDMWARIVDDLVHPPLYYYALKLFLLCFPNNHLTMIEAAKAFSVLWVSALMIFGSRMLEKRHNSFAALLFVLFLSGNMSVGYSVEIRMYSMAMCLTAIAAIYGYDVSKTGETKAWIGFTVFTILAAYTNYFALVAIALFWLWLLIGCVQKKQLRPWIISAAVCVLSYLPWIITVLKNRKEVTDYTADVTPGRMARLFLFPFSGRNDIVTALLVILSALLVLMIILEKKGDAFVCLCIACPVVLGLFCGLASFAAGKFVIGRYLLPGWGIFWMGLAIGASRLSRKEWIIPAIVVIQLPALYFIWRTENLDKTETDRLIACADAEPLPFYAESGVADMITWLTGITDYAEDGMNNPSGRYYVYYWSDDWQFMHNYFLQEAFVFSVHEVDVYTFEP